MGSIKLKRSSTNNKTKSSTIWTLLLGSSLITLFFDTEVADPFNTPKLIILVLLAAWLFGHLFTSLWSNTLNQHLQEKYPIYISILFILAFFISTLYSDNFISSLIGATQRRNGFISYCCFVIIFIYTIQNFKQLYLLRFFSTITVLSLILSFYGLLQILNKDFVTWNNPYNSMISTLGNPNFASALLAIFSAISILQLNIKAIPKILKIISLISLTISLFCIVKSESRQGLIALTIAILFYVFCYVYINHRKYFVPVAFFILILLAFGILGMLQKGPLSNLLYKESVSTRGFYWRAAIKMFTQNPFTGVGVDDYGTYFKSFTESEYTSRYGYEITSSNAHNIFLQLFSTAGFFVGLFYILIQLAVLIISLKCISKFSSEKQKIVLTLLSAWIAYQSQSLISIENIGLAIWGWVLGGIVIGIVNSFLNDPINELNKFQKNVHSNNNLNLFQPIISLISIVLTIPFLLNIYMGETNIYKIRSYLNYQDINYNKEITRLSNEIIVNRLTDPNYKFEASGALFEIGSQDQAFTVVKDLEKQYPKNLNYLKGLAAISEYNKNYVSSLNYRLKLAKWDPWNAPNYIEIIKLAKLSNNPNLAKQYFDQLLKFVKDEEILKLARTAIQ